MKVGDRVQVISHHRAVAIIEKIDGPIIVRFDPIIVLPNGAKIFRYITDNHLDLILISPPEEKAEWSDMWEDNS